MLQRICSPQFISEVPCTYSGRLSISKELWSACTSGNSFPHGQGKQTGYFLGRFSLILLSYLPFAVNPTFLLVHIVLISIDVFLFHSFYGSLIVISFTPSPSILFLPSYSYSGVAISSPM